MAKMMSVALPVIAIGAAAFTGGTSLGLLGADAAATGAAGAGGLDAIIGAGTATDAGMVDSMATIGSGGSWLGNTIASVTPYLKAAATVGQVGGTAISAIGANEQGKAAKTEADYEANQLNQNANNQMASAEQKAEEQNLQTKYVLSNAAANAAAGGGAVTDPTVTTNMMTIAGRGQYRALTDLYQGQAAAQADTNKANADIFGGQQGQAAGQTKMYSTILGGASSLYDKYGSVPPWVQQQS